MSLIAALQAIAGIGVFASRAFLPLFVVALVARFPELVSWLPFVADEPVRLSERLAWMCSDGALVALGLLALAEMRLDKSPEARELLRDLEPWGKGAVAVVATFGLLDAETRGILEHLAAPTGAGLLVPRAGTWAAGGLALAVGGVVVAAAAMRARLLEHVAAADPDDGLGLQRFTSALEDLWAAGGILLVLLAPVIALVLAIVLLALIGWGERHLEAKAEAEREPCPACGEMLRAEAAACSSCGAPREELAEPSSRAWPDRWLPVADPAAFRALELLAQSRCPSCAERRDPRALVARSPHGCRWPAETSPAGGVGADWPSRLDAHLLRRAGAIAALSLVLGLVPVIGAVAALAFGRLRLASPYRRYLGLTGRLRARWAARALIFVLVLASGLPLASAAAAPLIVLVHVVAHRGAFRRATGLAG